MEARVQKTMAANPRRVAAIAIDFDILVSQDASEKELLALERAGRACPVARSLHPEVDQMLTFSFQRVSAEETSE